MNSPDLSLIQERQPPRTYGILVSIGVCWTIGSLIGCCTIFPWWTWFFIVVTSIPWLMCVKSQRLGFVWCVVASGLIASGRSARFEQTRPPSDIAHWIGTDRVGPISVRCRINRIIRPNLASAWCAAVENSQGEWEYATGRMLISGPLPTTHYGLEMIVRGRCRISRNQQSRMVLIEIVEPGDVILVQTNQNIKSQVLDIRKAALNLVKDSPIQTGINASIVSAIILGHRDEYWQEIALPFRDTGTAHLLAISGLHLAIVCGTVLLAARLFGFPPRCVVFIAIIATTLMLILADVRTPLARAGLMFLVATTLLGFRWRVSASTLLAVAAITMQWVNPRAVLDPSFQLSFAVVAALIWVVPMWNRRIAINGMRPSNLGVALRATTTAWLTATPIAAHHFGQFSLLGIPATIVMLPQVSTILCLGYTRLIFGWTESISMAIGWCLNTTTSILWCTATTLQAIPSSSIVVDPPSWWWVLLAETCGVLLLTTSTWQYRFASAVFLSVLWFAATWTTNIHSTT
ncbi:MAG: ComEC/Rec2 family competence protein [Phycisphaerales bacterium]|nr:ComEC/Rec2 family competence protein [Phycisphaerales bacterium]